MVNIVEKVLELSGSSGFDSNGGDFDLLREAVLMADLAGALSDETAEYTVFAPTDAAFIGLAQSLGYGGADEAGALGHIVDALTLLGGGDPVPLLQQVLTYHVVNGEVFKADVLGLADGTMIPTLQGGSVTLDLGTLSLGDLDTGIADPTLIGFDVDVSNGVIHVLDGVLLPLSVTGILSQRNTDFEIGDNGNEYFATGRGVDFIDGNGGRDIILAGSGNDIAIGGAGNDWMSGGRGADLLFGDAGHDKIFGGRGKDVIEGGSGRDWMAGGRGNDTFVFEAGSDKDTLVGFKDGSDKIDLSGYAGIEDFSDIEGDIGSGWFGSKIHLDDGDSIYLLGVRKHQIDESDFIFSGDAIA